MVKTSRFKLSVILLTGALANSGYGQDADSLEETLGGREFPTQEDESDPGIEREPTDPVVPGAQDYEPDLDEDYGFGVDEDDEFGVEDEFGGVEEEGDVTDTENLDDSPLFDAPMNDPAFEDDALSEPDIFEQ